MCRGDVGGWSIRCFPPAVGTHGAHMKAETKVQLALTIVGIPVIMLVVWNPSGSTKWPNPFREAFDSISKGGR